MDRSPIRRSLSLVMSGILIAAGAAVGLAGTAGADTTDNMFFGTLLSMSGQLIPNQRVRSLHGRRAEPRVRCAVVRPRLSHVCPRTGCLARPP